MTSDRTGFQEAALGRRDKHMGTREATGPEARPGQDLDPETPRSARTAFPFSAVLGNDDLKLALLLNAVDPLIGGVLLRGMKGSAKSTIARGFASLLGGRAPFVELPLGATEDRVVGTVDLAALVAHGERKFHPGLLHSANGGVLYVDEVNLLPDHLVDVLLDVAASGINTVERDGVSISHPCRIVLMGSMNPEEGDLRPQLLDRFGLSVEVAALEDPALRAQAVRRRLDFDMDPHSLVEAWRPMEDELRRRIAATTPAQLPPSIIDRTSALCASIGAEGLRADLVICRAAAALAGWEGRHEADYHDVRRVARMALDHRCRRSPLEQSGMATEALDEALDEAFGATGEREGKSQNAHTAGAPVERGHAQGDDSSPLNVDPPGGDCAADAAAGDARTHKSAGGPRHEADDPHGPGSAGNYQATPAAPFKPLPLASKPASPAISRSGAPGSRGAKLESRRGRLVGDRPPGDTPSPLSAIATVHRAAERVAAERAPRGRSASSVPGAAMDGRGRHALDLQPGDIREGIYTQRSANLVIIAIDTSGSMGARRRVEVTKTAMFGFLLDAYRSRDRIALVAFRDDSAKVVLQPTGSIEVARARLENLDIGGRTPLAAGISTALGLAIAAKTGKYKPLVALVSDGRANYAPAGIDPLEAAFDAAGQVSSHGISSVVVDPEEGRSRLGLGVAIAQAMGASYMQLSELSAPALGAQLNAQIVQG